MPIKGLILVTLFFCSPCFAQESVTLQLKWTHQFQFAGYYMAKEKGYYKELGLDVTIKPANPSMPDTFSPVASNNAQFGVAHSGILQQKVMGQPFVAMAAILQFSPYCWMVRDTSDIFHPRDFVNKRITEVSRIDGTELLVMLKRSGIDVDKLEVYGGKNPTQAWIENKLDAMQVYVTNEPYNMTQQGIAHRLVCPQRYGMDVYSDILFTNEYMLKKHPQTVENFYQASLKGWRYAIMNMDEAIAVTQLKYATHKNFHQLAYEAEVLREYIVPPTTNLGNMSMAKWRLIADLYGIGKNEFDEVKAGFIYNYEEPETMQLSWMLIAAILVSIISIPLYLRLIFSKK
ncbi:ABC transporter substrate-binding protein [Pseudoalteromonas sp. MMG006]|uniref:ABC transporter substrate-binding protein n=1 Tax=Pseudoalteromonas sp. MMG006 TaxID=2822683 RepID=UPI001B38A83A|nr:ABC transporter substrate-binding protein [Pseudoalteromonas sp. MMG006]MBQ4799396.1 ABC transporter substrate-binding protein [Pseudoalteromonas sp. MMG006]